MCLAGLAQWGAEGQGWEQAGNSAPSVPPLPTAQPCCSAWHLQVLKVTSSSVCHVGHEAMGYSFVEKDKLQISQHSKDKNQTASKVTHSKTGNVTSTWVHTATGSFSAFPTQGANS